MHLFKRMHEAQRLTSTSVRNIHDCIKYGACFEMFTCGTDSVAPVNRTAKRFICLHFNICCKRFCLVY